MSRSLLFFILVSFSISLGCRSTASPVVVGEKPISINDKRLKDAPRQPLKPVSEMNWTTDEGTVQKLKDFRDKIVVLDFWATYCPPCIEAIPHLIELQNRYPDDLRVIGLHVGGEEDRPKLPEFVEKLSITYTLGTPEDELTRFVFGDDTAIPQTAIFDREGKLVKKIVGFDEKIKLELDEAIESALAGTNVSQ